MYLCMCVWGCRHKCDGILVPGQVRPGYLSLFCKYSYWLTKTSLEFQWSFSLSVRVLTEERQVTGSKLTVTEIPSKFVCQRIRVCVRACVRGMKETQLMVVKIQVFYQTLFLYSIYLKPNTSFPTLGRVTDWETPSCVCWEDIFRCGDEVIYGWVQVRRFFVVNSRHLVLVRIKTHKKSPKIPGNAFSDALLMSGFQIFSNWKLRFARFLFEQTQLRWVGYFSNERGFSVESSLQVISSIFLLWKRNDLSVVL